MQMRYAIISDIHSNLEALKAVLHELDAAQVGSLLCLGDIVGYGPNPNECCEILRERDCVAVAGNHDEAALSHGDNGFNSLAQEAIVWTQSKLTRENQRFLRNLPRERQFETFMLVHGAPVNHFDYILNALDAQRAFRRVSKALTFIGHTHVAEVYYQGVDGRTYEQKLLHGGRIEIVPEYQYLVNVGSVGQPRDYNPQASFAIYDEEAGVVEVRRVSYDIHTVQQRMQDAKLPAELSARLSIGY